MSSVLLALVMALQFAHGAVQWLATDAATTQYVVSGLGFQPQGLRFYWQGLGSATDTTSTAAHSRRGMGVATGTAARRCVATQDQDAAATIACTTGHFTDCIAATVTSTPERDGALDLHAVGADGFTLIVDDQAPVDLTICWEAWGGCEVAAIGDITEPAATGDQDYTVTGFDTVGLGDQVVFVAGVQQTAADTVSRGDSGFCVGWATGAAENLVIMGNSQDNVTTSNTDGYEQFGECLAMEAVGGASLDARATLSQFNTNGFRLNWIARGLTNRRYIYLAMKGGRWKAGEMTILYTPGETASVTGLTFSPLGLCMLGRQNATDNTPGVAIDQDFIKLGTGSGPSSRQSMGQFIQHGVADAVINSNLQYDVLLADASNTNAVDYDAVLGDGFRLIYDGPANDAVERWLGYLAFGQTPRQWILTRTP